MKAKQKKLLCEYVNFTCEQCKKKFELKDLECHRIRRGNVGGTYEHRNVKILCKSCHKKYHSGEFK